MGKKYKTPFCQNDTDNQRCIFDYLYMYILNQEVGYNCEKSCSIKEYIGETYLNNPYTSDGKDQDKYKFKYRLNDLATTKVYEEYLVYDAIGMVGSVGGTLGMYIEFLITYLTFFLF